MSEYRHDPVGAQRGVLVLTHGAGSNANAPLLVAVAEAFAANGFGVLRYDLPFREARPHGPPFPAQAAQDRAGIKRAIESVRAKGWTGRLIAGGHSYGGRQTSMLAAEDPTPDVDQLLLLSYPLHPPNKPQQLRTAHFAGLRTPTTFVHGSRDPFGTLEELREAIQQITARTELIEVAGAAHDLKPFRWISNLCESALIRG